MSIFAIGDLHLPGGDKKPMDVFGAHWEHHFERICADWQSRVREEDIVLIDRDGTLIRFACEQVSVIGRLTQGG